MITKGIFLLYRLALTAATPAILLYFLGRSIRRPGYFSTLGERLGGVPLSYGQTGSGGIWLHAVSVGEALSLAPLARMLRSEAPEAPLFISVGTLAGRAVADEKLKTLVDGVFYAPLDLAWVIRRVLRRIRPSVVAIAETEIWPNLFRETKRAGCGLIVVNGRISDRASTKYDRFRQFFAPFLRFPDRILAQNAASRERFLRLGAPAERVVEGGNLKYDFQSGAPSEAVDRILDRIHPAEVWIAASTMPPDEDDIVIDALRELRRPGLLLILVPRKPESFEPAARKLAESGLPWTRRSAPGPLELPGALLLDSMGELGGLFPRADVVFMGGTIAPKGGHNILEPAAAAKPVIVGPHMENFGDIANAFRAAGAMVEIGSGDELAGAVRHLLSDRVKAAEIGRRAKACADSRRGATALAVKEILRLRAEAVPRWLPPLPVRLLAPLYRWGAGLKRRLTRPRRLTTPVISVGNLTMGGAGKTPLVLYLAGKLPGSAILTRGYGRRRASNLILGPGETADWRDTGDEAQIYLRSGVAAVGIGADRAAVGRAMEERRASGGAAAYPVKRFILDDGFQHWRLARDVDIVLIDALDPFPRDRMRESLTALGRADAFVITRADGSRPGIERVLRKRNPSAPIFYARMEPAAWVEGVTGRRLDLRDASLAGAAAFCGLANPGAFWTSLARAGIRPAARVAFPDHAEYDSAEIAALIRRHGKLLTTEKDWVKLGSIPGVYWLEAPLDVDAGLLDLLLKT